MNQQLPPSRPCHPCPSLCPASEVAFPSSTLGPHSVHRGTLRLAGRPAIPSAPGSLRLGEGEALSRGRICPGVWGKGKCCWTALGRVLKTSGAWLLPLPPPAGACQPNCQLRSPGSLGQPKGCGSHPVSPKVMARNGFFRPKSLILVNTRELQLQFRNNLPRPPLSQSLPFLHI